MAQHRDMRMSAPAGIAAPPFEWGVVGRAGRPRSRGCSYHPYPTVDHAGARRFEGAPCTAELGGWRGVKCADPTTAPARGYHHPMFDHVTIRVTDRPASERFYATVLSALGIE